MTALGAHGSAEANQAYLAACLAELRCSVEGRARPSPPLPIEPSAMIERVAGIFALSGFERELLLLCAGMELDASFARACREAAQGEPSFGFALAILPDAHWSALTPAAPLRYWRLLGLRTSESLNSARLRIEERVLHALVGVAHLDERLHGLVRPHHAPPDLPEDHVALADRIATIWASASARGAAWPALQLVGPADAGAADVAAAACAAQGLGLCTMRAADLPLGFGERTEFERLWAREAAFGAHGLLIEVASADGQETLRAVAAFAARPHATVLVSGTEPLDTRDGAIARLDLPKPSRTAQAALWRAAFAASPTGPRVSDTADDPLGAAIDAVTDHFDFGPRAIATTAGLVRADAPPGDRTAMAERLWPCCRVQARGRLDDLAQRIETDAGWDALVLPPEQMRVMHEIVANVRQRGRVYEDWGFAAQGPRGLGISALFAGTSGTGKTLAAEIVAHALRLDLYRIDLSQVVSKYIGETEKNLERVFAAAETAGAVLLFDEADALFGKRSEVKDSHDRYANMEVSYLLQRMETYRGLAILTTNQPQALDPAFRRRIRFIVQFPFPDECQRAAIWARVFPTRTPVEGLDTALLARLNVGGGNIRNIALGAAFAAAEQGHAVTMLHLLRSARAECAKLGRSLTAAEIAGWG